MDSGFRLIQSTLDYINSVPAHSWYVAGTLITASGLTFVIVNIIKNSYLKRRAEELGKKLVQFNLFFWGIINSTAAFLVINGGDINALAEFAPFLKEYVAPVMVIASWLYTFGGNKVYNAIAAKLKEWATKKPAPVLTPTEDLIPPVAPEAGTDFLS